MAYALGLSLPKRCFSVLHTFVTDLNEKNRELQDNVPKVGRKDKSSGGVNPPFGES